LNHASGTFAGVAGIYNRFAYAEEMRSALQRWEHHVFRLACEITDRGWKSGLGIASSNPAAPPK
jgi:hypothetical protein